MYYKNSDYTAKKDGDKYFVQFHGQADMPEIEVDAEMFALYISEFHKPLERQRWERRKHMDFYPSEKLSTEDVAGQWEVGDTVLDLEAALKCCTPTQRRRFMLYCCGCSFTEIAKAEQCDISVVRRSILAAQKKLKNIFEQ